MALGIMNPVQKQRFDDTREVDLAYGIPGLGRFRVNVFQQRGTVGIVFRAIPFGVMISSLNIVLDRVTRSRLAGEPPDVHIAPKLGRIGIAEFDRAAEMIAIGEEAARDALPDIIDAMSVFGIPGSGASLPPPDDGADLQEGEQAP